MCSRSWCEYERSATLPYYLRDILEAMEAVESFVAGMDFNAYMEDFKTRSAVVRQFEIMGEAAKMVPEAIRNDYPGVAWKNMAGMRNRLVHAYFRVDYALVWDTIKTIVPAEKFVVKRIIQQYGDRDG